MNIYQLGADGVVFLHAAYIGFVVLGLPLILWGAVRGWAWTRNFWFRLTHLSAILVVVAEALLGIVCPLTTLENYLRTKSGASVEAGSFVGRWLHELIFVEVSEQYLTAGYSLFGFLVLLTFLLAPPRWPRRVQESRTGDTS